MSIYRLSKSPEVASVEQERLSALYKLEEDHRLNNMIVVGADEVGRGSLAGPVTVCACQLPHTPYIEWLNDSKALTKLRRKRVADALVEVGARYAIAHVAADVIDDIGIVQALRQAFTKAVIEIATDDSVVILDGTPLNLDLNEQYVVKGDSRVAAIAAASVLAKQARDELMIELSDAYPEYSLASNKGYGSAAHMEALRNYGPSPVHRKSFCSQILSPTLF